MSRQRVKTQRGIMSYFAAIPHMADDDLDIYEYRLYGHYKRICGEQNNPCEESVRDTARKLGVSHPKIIEARRSLETKGYILVEQEAPQTPLIITLLDLWPENMQRFSGSVVSQTGSQDSQGGSVVSQIGSVVSQPTHKESDKNKEPKRTEERPAAYPLEDQKLTFKHQAAYDAYQRWIGPIAPHNLKQLDMACELYSQEWMIEACELTQQRYVEGLCSKPSFGYMMGIVRRWATNGYDGKHSARNDDYDPMIDQWLGGL